jgi:UDP-N-acetylglucosamine diphosphorylase/glucosamine-1-phosphate N-acetyltransferase
LLAIVILAAGKGTRMNSDLPKVLHRLGGLPLVQHVVNTALALSPDRLLVVVGHGRDQVIESVTGQGVEWVIQEPQLGTGHAVQQAASVLKGFHGDVLVLSGDAPLLRVQTLRRLLEEHRNRSASATVLSADAADPGAYGRIVRDREGTFERIVEARDAKDAELSIREINSGIYCFRGDPLFAALREVRTDNSKGEYYLTDVVGILKGASDIVQAIDLADLDEVRGINTAGELADAEESLRCRLEERAP